jgi:hypothetical protein
MSENEVNGEGNMTTALYWQLDTRLGRRWNLDPKYLAGESRYSTFSNNPIMYIDPLGDFRYKFMAKVYAKIFGGKVAETKDKDGEYFVENISASVNVKNKKTEDGISQKYEVTYSYKKTSDWGIGSAVGGFFDALDKGVASIRGSKENYGEGENKAPFKTVDVNFKEDLQISRLKISIGAKLTDNGSEKVKGGIGLDLKFDNNPKSNSKIDQSVFLGFNGIITKGEKNRSNISGGVKIQYGIFQTSYTSNTNGENKVSVGVGFSTKKVDFKTVSKITSETTIMKLKLGVY